MFSAHRVLPKQYCSMNSCKSVASRLFPLHVMGAGSIGLLYASRIQEAYKTKFPEANKSLPPPVTLLMRSHHKPYLIRSSSSADQSDGSPCLLAPVTILCNNGDRKYDIPVEIIGGASEALPIIHSLLLCTKATDACKALASVWHRLGASSSGSPARTIVLSNGALAIRDSILKSFPRHDVEIIFASTTHGAYRDNSLGQYCIRHAGEGLTHSTDREFISTCHEIGWKSYELTDFEMNVMLWKKLAVNCVINPLTAIHGVKNGQLLGLKHGDQDIRLTMTGLLEEVSCIALKEVESQIADTNPELIYAAQKELSLNTLQAFVEKVMVDTTNNISSMLQDVKAKRETEVHFLNGHVSRIGKEKYDMDCPFNTSMCTAVDTLITARKD
jgi:2-dehydropantoate 2-reductase